MSTALADPVLVDFATGDATGLTFPAHPQALRGAGPAFLTAAFRAYGALADDNEVIAITHAEPCLAGNSGEKLFLSVEYARPEPGLHTDLFVKFSRYFPDAFRDRRKFELEPEVRLAALSRLPAFPVAVAKPYFADFDHASGTGVLITQQVRFGEDGIQPVVHKCMDHELPNALKHYQTTLPALARLAAAGKSGALLPEIDQLFPYEPEAAAAELPIPWTEQTLREAMERLRNFAQVCPQLLPANVAAPGFVDRLERGALNFLRHEAEVRRFLFADPDYVALLHWNTHLDNAWFWRDEAGALQCGLLDWGMVRHMNVATSVWGGVSCAEPALLEAELPAMLALFASELQRHGGPTLDLAELDLHFDLAVAMIGMAMMMDLPKLVLGRMPDVIKAAGPLDPMLRQDQVVHGFHYSTSNFLSTWERRDFGASLDRMLARSGAAR